MRKSGGAPWSFSFGTAYFPANKTQMNEFGLLSVLLLGTGRDGNFAEADKKSIPGITPGVAHPTIFLSAALRLNNK
jgi:hypothetical protein